MLYARIAGGIVAELIDIEANGTPLAARFHPDLVATLVVLPEGSTVAVGWTWDGDAFAAPPVAEPLPPVVPAEISRRQLLLALRAAGLITDDEALAAATSGAVPAEIDAVFAALPAADATAARITWATMASAERAHPLIMAMIAAEVATSAQVDAVFIAAAGM